MSGWKALAIATIILLAATAAAESPYAAFEECPCKFLGVGVPWADYADPVKLAALIGGKAEPYLLVDVRTAEEYGIGHIETAINLPLAEIADRPPQVDKADLVILYCKSGIRSAQAAEKLRALGYRGIVDFGGIARWPGPLVTGPQP